MKAKPKIVVHGMMRSSNFGDMILCKIVVDWVKEHGKFNPVAFGGSPEVLSYLNLDVGSFWDFLSASAVVMCGGGFFQPDQTGRVALKKLFFTNGLPFFLGSAMFKPSAFVGVGVAKPEGAVYRFGLRHLIRSSGLFAVRDHASFFSAKSVSSSGNVELTADLVFSQNGNDFLSNLDREATHGVANGLRERTLCLHVSHGSAHSEDYRKYLEILASELEARRDLRIVLIEDHPSSPGLGQRAAWGEIGKFIEGGRVSFVEFKSPEHLCSVINSADAVLSNKLHVALVAARLGVPAFSIAKNGKNISAFRDLGISENCVLLSDDPSEIRRVVQAAASARGTFEVPHVVCDRALRNKQLLFDFLDNLTLAD